MKGKRNVVKVFYSKQSAEANCMPTSVHPMEVVDHPDGRPQHFAIKSKRTGKYIMADGFFGGV